MLDITLPAGTAVATSKTLAYTDYKAQAPIAVFTGTKTVGDLKTDFIAQFNKEEDVKAGYVKAILAADVATSGKSGTANTDVTDATVLSALTKEGNTVVFTFTIEKGTKAIPSGTLTTALEYTYTVGAEVTKEDITAAQAKTALEDVLIPVGTSVKLSSGLQYTEAKAGIAVAAIATVFNGTEKVSILVTDFVAAYNELTKVKSGVIKTIEDKDVTIGGTIVTARAAVTKDTLLSKILVATDNVSLKVTPVVGAKGNLTGGTAIAVIEYRFTVADTK